MSNGVNKVFFGGNLGADPELRVTQSGQSMLKLRIASTESYLDKNRQRQEKTEWMNAVVWGRRGEGLAKFLTKGMQVLIEGQITTRSYEDRDGNKRYMTEIAARNVFVGGSNNPRNKNQMRDPQERRPNVRDHDDDDHSSGGGGGGGYDDQDYGGGGSDDDIPF